MRPVRHAEVEARRGPFPPPAVGGIVQSVHAEEVAAGDQMVVQLTGQHAAVGIPAHAVEGFQPCPGALVQMRDAAGDLGLAETAAARRGIVARGRKPADRAEIVQILQGAQAAAHVVAAVDQAALRIPVIDGLEITLFGKLGHDFGIVQAEAGRVGVDLAVFLGEQGVQMGNGIIALAGAEDAVHPFAPGAYVQVVHQFVLEEVIHALPCLGIHAVFEGLEIVLHHAAAEVGMKLRSRLGVDEFHTQAVRRIAQAYDMGRHVRVRNGL